MKKTPELKNLVFENIYSESLKFYPPTEDSYIKTYPEFIQFFKNISNITNLKTSSLNAAKIVLNGSGVS